MGGPTQSNQPAANPLVAAAATLPKIPGFDPTKFDFPDLSKLPNTPAVGALKMTLAGVYALTQCALGAGSGSGASGTGFGPAQVLMAPIMAAIKPLLDQALKTALDPIQSV